jgi:hypothetical protein
MNYAIEVGSGVMIYIPSITKPGSGIQKFLGGTQQGKLICLLSFFQNKESRLKMVNFL